MNGYLFNAGVRQTRFVADRGMQTWDSAVSAILYGSDLAQAQRAFEARLAPKGDDQGEVEIKKVGAAQLVDQVLTESGGRPVNWAEISQRALDPDAATAVDPAEQGLWLDVSQLAPIGGFPGDIDSLQRELPEDICSGLNWSPVRQCLFLVTVLSPPPPPPDPDAEFEEEQTHNPPGADLEERTDDLDGFVASLPEMRDKETAALVEARNALVAAFLWRKFVTGTPVAANEIHIGQCCPILSAE